MASRGPSEILRLVLTIPDESSSDLKERNTPLLPLTLDRVMEGRSRVSTAALLSLPDDILFEILCCIDQPSLANLAFVNTDCRQLARSVQFVTCQFDYGRRSRALLEHLLEERQQRLSPPNKHERLSMSIGPSIGACIRRVTVTVDQIRLAERHHLFKGFTFGALQESLKEQRLSEASHCYFDIWIKALGTILATSAGVSVLPNLETLDWDNQVALPQLFFESLGNTHIQKLRLLRVPVDEDFDIIPVQGVCRIRMLHLETVSDLGVNIHNSITSSFSSKIIQRCAPTLETLIWENPPSRSDSPATIHLQTFLNFPRLRNLCLGEVQPADSALVRSLLSSPISILEISLSKCSVIEACLAECGCIYTLKTLILNDLFLESFSPGFFKANPQIERLAYCASHGPDLAKGVFFSILCSSFSNLTSLSITWPVQTTAINSTALEMISCLPSLENLHLSAGFEGPRTHWWVIDHDLLREHLAPLQNLKRLAFSGDTYSTKGYRRVVHYYQQAWSDEYPVHPNDNWRREIAIRDRWEEKHRRRIMSEADSYAKILPKLHWMFVGQLQMAAQDPNSQPCRWRLVSEKRDVSSIMLQRMFGWYRGSDW